MKTILTINEIGQGESFTLFMKTLMTISVFALLVACGQPINITYHYDTPASTLEGFCGYPCSGYAHRENKVDREDITQAHFDGHWQCDIWLVSQETVTCWKELVAHEERHCHEGSFHPDTPEGSLLMCN